jgi:hypothetical protein
VNTDKRVFTTFYVNQILELDIAEIQRSWRKARISCACRLPPAVECGPLITLAEYDPCLLLGAYDACVHVCSACCMQSRSTIRQHG